MGAWAGACDMARHWTTWRFELMTTAQGIRFVEAMRLPATIGIPCFGVLLASLRLPLTKEIAMTTDGQVLELRRLLAIG